MNLKKNLTNLPLNFVFLLLLLSITSCSSTNHKETVISSNEKSTNQSLINHKFNNEKNINGKYINPNLPELTVDTINYFNKKFPVNIVENSNLDDFAEASRFYSPNSFNITQQCVIIINFKLITHMSKLENNTELFKTFVYLHELAHCDDDEPPPKNINSYEWKE